MAQTITLPDFKRGDTPTFRFNFTDPYVGFDWSAITLDCALTDETAPTTNAGANAIRLNQTLQTDADGAYYEFTLTVAESKALTPGGSYMAECQLKQGSTSVATPVTAKVKVLQDYII